MDETLEESKQSGMHPRASLLVTVLLVVAVAFCLYAAVQVLSNGYVNLGGMMMFRVVTGSMEPTIPVGALLVTKQVDIGTIQIDDIICFRTQASEIWGKIVTHRVVDIWQSETGALLLATKGDANLVADGYLVDQMSLVGKVIWHTGNRSLLAGILSLFTSKIGFLGCIVLPSLLLSTLILRDTVGSIRQELQMVLEMEQLQQNRPEPWENDPLCGMTQEEYMEMYERIRAELMEELKYFVEIQKEQKASSEVSETE